VSTSAAQTPHHLFYSRGAALVNNIALRFAPCTFFTPSGRRTEHFSMTYGLVSGSSGGKEDLYPTITHLKLDL
jgi:hypothetical protein